MSNTNAERLGAQRSAFLEKFGTTTMVELTNEHRQIGVTLADLADTPRWVAWRLETRNERDTKIPYDPNGNGFAASNNAATWGTREQAQQRWDELRVGLPSTTPETKAGGVHVTLGDLGDGTLLTGIDLDCCFSSLDDNDVAPWANEVVNRFATYAEVSPSGLGVKLFFLIAASDAAALRQLLAGKTSKKFGAGEHREIVLDTAKFYAVTDLQLGGNVPSTLRLVPLDDVRWFLEQAGPRYQERHGVRNDGRERQRTRDESGSGYGFRFMCARKAAGDDYQDARAALLDDQGPAGEWARRSDERQLERAWENATEEEPTKQADLLVHLAASANLFHASDDHAGFADIQINGHRETWAIKSPGFKLWLNREYYRHTNSAPNSNAMSTALQVLDAKARFDSPAREVVLRIAGHNGKIYLDLCDADWRVVEIDANGWRLVVDPPVRFVRRNGMLALPVPQHGGKVWALQKYVNVPNRADFILVIAWLVAALNPRGPYPVLDVTGEAGSAKSTLLTLLRNLIDPNMTPLRAPPRDERDVFIAAGNAWVLCYDNLSYLKDWLSDALARLSTGGGFATRMLYTDDEERLFTAQRPILLGAIEEVVKRGDLADRIAALPLAPISDQKRRRERELLEAFERDRPAILGALLKAVAHGLAQLPNVSTASAPRLADFFDWAIACGDGWLWKRGEFAKAYTANRASVTAEVVEADPLAAAVREFVSRSTTPNPWTGTATELLRKLEFVVGERIAASKRWPSSPSALGQRLARIATPLRRLGIEIVRLERQGHARSRLIKISASEEVRNSLSALSALSAPPESVRANQLQNNDIYNADSADRRLHTTTTPVVNVRPLSAANLGIGARPRVSPNFHYRRDEVAARAGTVQQAQHTNARYRQRRAQRGGEDEHE
jgi:hypothetical protein